MIARAARIYDKVSRTMLYPQDMARLGVFLDGTGTAVQVKKKGLFSKTVVAKLQNVVVMYLTGLKTDRGEDIWEGDILDVDIPTDWGSCLKARGYMQWHAHDGKWFVHIPNPPALIAQGEDFHLVGATRQGDIYQTPELLKV